MAETSPNGHLLDRLQGALYAFLHVTVRHSFIGPSISSWLKNVPLLLIPLMLLLGWPIAWPMAMLALALILRLFYWKAKRDGYVRFAPEPIAQPGEDGPALADNEKVLLEATGLFSVKDWEAYVLGRPAEYWRVAMGDHTIMVNHSPGRFLYQFIRNGTIESIQPGLLCYGTHPCSALAITYLTAWKPNADDVDFMFYAPSDESSPSRRREKMFLAFNDESDRDAVWRSLLTALPSEVT